jgi:hypothetical protein
LRAFFHPFIPGRSQLGGIFFTVAAFRVNLPGNPPAKKQVRLANILKAERVSLQISFTIDFWIVQVICQRVITSGSDTATSVVYSFAVPVVLPRGTSA